MLDIQKNNQQIAELEENINDIMQTSAFSASQKKIELVKQKITSIS